MNEELIYMIELNEGQRKILETALQTLHSNANCVFSKQPGTGCGGADTEFEEYQLLLDMFTELPKIERENPEIVHSFCS